MKRLVLISTLLVAFVATAYADVWDKTFSLSGKPEFTLRTGDGNVRIDPWEKNEIAIHVSTVNWHIGGNGDDSLTITTQQSGNRVSFDLPTHWPHDFSFFHSMHRRVDIEIHMPKHAHLDIETHDGSIHVRDMVGEFRIQSGDGSQALDGLDGSLDAKSGDGRIEVNGRFDRLDLHSGDGAIRASVAPGSKLAGPWSMRAGDGSIHLRLPRDIAATVDLHTGDGHIHTDLPITVKSVRSTHNMQGTLNGGGENLFIRTGDGSIDISSN